MAVQVHEDYKLIIAFNRDEFFDRPTAPAEFWKDSPDLLAGMDLKAGGTWFGVTRQGRIAGITNNQDPGLLKNNAPSRGKLTCDFLLSKEISEDYLQSLIRESKKYSGFNLIMGVKDDLYWYSNLAEHPRHLDPGIYGLSNHLLDTDWPKVREAKAALETLLAEQRPLKEEDLFSLMKSSRGGERQSSIFIPGPDYGTRTTTLLLMDHSDLVTFIERNHDAGRQQKNTCRFQFAIKP